MWSKRIQGLAAMLCAGDGMLALAQPYRQASFWEGRHGWTRRVTRPFVERPWLTQLVGALELGLAMMWARRLTALR
jgi:hypothetical protein